jgi:L-iditol 2-dehydrogenase
MISLLRRGTHWNVFGITTPETFELEGGLTHFLEARMDASFGTNTEAMSKAIRLMERGVIDPGKIVTHRFPLTKIHEALEVMGSPEHNKIMICPEE